MTTGMKTVIYPVTDLPAAREMYAAVVGAEPYVDTPYYVGFRSADQEIGLDPNGHANGLTGPLGYWHVADIRASVGDLTARGATVTSEVSDVGGGKLVATLSDADGNAFGLLQMTGGADDARS